MTNRIYTSEKTCPLCHKNKAMFTLSIEGEKNTSMPDMLSDRKNRK